MQPALPASLERAKETLPVLVRLLARGTLYRRLKVTGRAARPEALTFEVTRRCIARCVMCNIWRTPASCPELQSRDWLELLGSPALRELKELDITGGEPFLRDDLGELLNGIAALRSTRLVRLRSVAITTNGFLTRTILREVAAVIDALEGAGLQLVFACGMDAVGQVHDRMRNVEGGWARLHATLQGLAALRDRHPNLVLGIKTTVTRHNVGELESVCRYADDNGLFTIVSPYILTANRYANLDLGHVLDLSSADVQALKAFYASPRFRWSFHRAALLRFLDTGRMEKPCSAGFNYFFVRSTGELHPCPIAGASLGNVRQTPFGTLMRSAEAARFRRSVNELPECATCTEPGLERYALPFEGFHYLRLYLRLGGQAFLDLHRHLGLGKYF